MLNIPNYGDRVADVPMQHRHVGDAQTLLWLVCMIGRIRLAEQDLDRYMRTAVEHLLTMRLIATMPAASSIGGLVVDATTLGRQRFADSLVEKDPDGRYSVTLDIPHRDTTTHWSTHEHAVQHAVDCFADADMHEKIRQQSAAPKDPVAAAWGIDSAAVCSRERRAS